MLFLSRYRQSSDGRSKKCHGATYRQEADPEHLLLLKRSCTGLV